MASLPGELDGERVLRALSRFGWTQVAQRGSHRKLTKPGRPGFLLVAFHQTIGRHAVRKILRQAGIPESEFLGRL